MHVLGKSPGGGYSDATHTNMKTIFIVCTQTRSKHQESDRAAMFGADALLFRSVVRIFSNKTKRQTQRTLSFLYRRSLFCSVFFCVWRWRCLMVMGQKKRFSNMAPISVLSHTNTHKALITHLQMKIRRFRGC